MPYSVGEKGSYGCSGYPAVKDDGEVMGCHDTREQAEAQIFAINVSEGNVEAMSKAYSVRQGVEGCDGYAVVAENGDLVSCFSTEQEAKDYARATSEGQNPEMTTNTDNAVVSTGAEVSKQSIQEGDYVMGMTVDGIAHGLVEHIMWEGGTLGQPGSEYALESMPPQNPAMSVRIFESNEDGTWEATPYSIGMMYQDAEVLPSLDGHVMPEEMQDQMVSLSKAETYAPNDGMKSAARRALKWKEEGKAKGAGTPVGWGRATDIAAGRSMSLSVVKRMFSFFSRHEVNKKAKGFSAGEEGYPSNGRIMWDAWGGDAGFSWSRSIAQREADKALFSNFGKDFTTSESLSEIFKSIGVGSMVSWNSSGGRARGKVIRIIRDGSYNVPGTEVTVTGSKDDPAAVIRLYRDGESTDVIVAHKIKSLRQL